MWNVVQDDGVVREEGGAFIVVVAGLIDGVPHVDESHQLHQEGAPTQDDLSLCHLFLCAHEADHPTGAHAVVSAGQVPLHALVADIVIGVVGPVEGECGVAGDLE